MSSSSPPSDAYGYCGGVAPPDENTCRFDACAADDDCGAGRACLPRGAFGALVRQCVDAACRSDGDCTERTGGACLPLWTGGCRSLAGFYCTYDDDVCRTDDDCSGGSQLCEPGDGGTVCAFEAPPP